MRISDWSSDVCSSDLYDEVMALIPVLPRPLRLVILQPVEEEKKTAPGTPSRTAQTPHASTPQHQTPVTKQSPRHKAAVASDDEDDDDIPAASQKLIRKSRSKEHQRAMNGSAASEDQALHANGHATNGNASGVDDGRSEERRVGKEGVRT